MRAHLHRLDAAAPLAFDPGRLEAGLTRIQRSAEAMRVELTRAGEALGAIVAAARELRLPEAVMAFRMASVAVRALRALF